jgi:hypothetical protein
MASPKISEAFRAVSSEIGAADTSMHLRSGKRTRSMPGIRLMAFRIVGTMNMYAVRSRRLSGACECAESGRLAASNFSAMTLRPPPSQIGVNR